jgi:hypothetical protein
MGKMRKTGLLRRPWTVVHIPTVHLANGFADIKIAG